MMGLLVDSNIDLAPIKIIKYYSGESLYWLLPTKLQFYSLQNDEINYESIFPWHNIPKAPLQSIIKHANDFTIFEHLQDGRFLEALFYVEN